MHENARLLFARYAVPLFTNESRVLEIGPDDFPSSFQRLVSTGAIEWHTLDICEEPRLTYSAVDPYRFPIPDDTYDIVLSGQVIEHVAKIWDWLRELARICRPEGQVITIGPVSWPYHKSPIDCWRIFPDGMRALYEYAGLHVESSRCESLEAPHLRRPIPGRSSAWQPRRQRVFAGLLNLMNLPVERAYDTITIGRKPSGPFAATSGR